VTGLQRKILTWTIVLRELANSLWVGVSKSVDTLVIVTCSIDLASPSSQFPDNFKVTGVEVLIFVNEHVLEIILEIEIWILVQSAPKLIDQFCPECVAKHPTVLSPRSKEGRIGE